MNRPGSQIFSGILPVFFKIFFMKKPILCFPVFLFFHLIISAQPVSEYKFLSSQGSYTALDPGTETVLWTGTFDNSLETITIPAYTITGTSYTSMTISSNGFVTFGSTVPSTSYYTPISGSTAYDASISPFGINLENAETGTPKVSYNTNVSGEIVVQWQDVKRSSAAGDQASFQLRLDPATGQIRFIYGNVTATYTGTSYGLQVGLRGTSNDDFNNRTTTTSWSATTAGTGSSATCRFNNTVYPASGLTFTWKPLYNPTNFTAKAVNFNNIDLTWTRNSLNHNVILAYNTSATFGTPADGATYNAGDFVSGGGTVLYKGSGTSYSHTSLTQSTQYFYKIWSYDAANDYSTGIIIDTRTAYPIPYSQDFNASSLPAEWSTDMSSTASHGIVATRGLTRRLSSSGASAYAISPMVGSITSGSSLSFHYRIVDYTGYPLNGTSLGSNDKIDVQVSTDDGATFTTIHTIDHNNHVPSTVFAAKMLSLSAYNGSYIKIRFLCSYAAGDYYADIDNVIIDNNTSMSYAASTTEQASTANAGTGTSNNEIIRLLVVTQKETSPLSITQITFNTTGSTNASGDIAAAKVFYTTTPTFGMSVQFGSIQNNPSGSFTISGNQTLSPGHNYFWLAYDLRTTATSGNVIDAQCTQFITSESAVPKTPAATNPSGTRKIGPDLGGTKTIPGDYPTIAAAVTAINSGTVATGGVTFNVSAGHTETSTAAIILTATGRPGSVITFRKSGTGNNPLVTRTDAGSVSTTTVGNHGDGVIIMEGPDYVIFDGIDVTASDQGIEYGYYLRKVSVTDACSNVTVKNATITMTKGTSRSVAGICAGNNSNSSSNIAIIALSGAHENITITGNTVSNVFMGIILKGDEDFNDHDFIIGTSGSGNTIQNFGGNTAYETAGIWLDNIDDADVSYNNIHNTAGGGTSFTGAAGYGIFNYGILTNNFTATHNNIIVSTQASGFGNNLYGIRNRVNGLVRIENNTLTLTSSAATSIGFYYISNEPNSATDASIVISNNQFGISSSPHTGTIYFINNPNSQQDPAMVEIKNNATTGSISRTEPGGTTYLYFNDGSPTGTEIISGNTFSNISQSGASSFTGIHSVTTSGHTQQVYDNTISNITSGSNAFTAIYLAESSSRSVHGNLVNNITTSGTITGIQNGNGNSTVHIFANDITGLSSSSAATTGTVVSGITVAAGTSVYIYNNFITDLNASASGGIDAIRGISLTSTQSNSVTGLYYNTIYLNATSSGSIFGSAAVYHTASATATMAQLDMRNNILVNTSVPNGTGRTIVLKRSAASLDNFAETSDNNILYAGTPGSKNVIYNYASAIFQTLDEYKIHVAPREASSHTEMPPFLDITTPPYNLRLPTNIPTLAEGTGQVITSPVSITTDFDGQPRGSSPDIGADEFSGLSAFVENPLTFAAVPASSQQNSLSFAKNTAGNNVILVCNTTGTFTSPSGSPAVGGSLAGGTVLFTGTVSPYVHGGLTPGTTYYYKAFSYDGASYSTGKVASSIPGVSPVTALTSTPVNESKNSLSWSKNNAGHDVMVASHNVYIEGNPVNGTIYNMGDAIPNGGTVIYRGPASGYDHSGLNEWTQYYYKVWSVDAFSFYSAATTTNTVTYPSPVTSIPYLQDFNGTWNHNPEAPQGWEVASTSTTFTWEKSSLISKSEPAGARGHGNGNCDDYLISPPIVLPDEGIQLSWWDYVSDVTNITRYKVLLSTAGKDTSAFTTVLGDYTCDNNDWEMRTIDLSAYKGQNIHIAFFLYYTESQYKYFAIDDVLIESLIPGSAVPVSPVDGQHTFTGSQILQWSAATSSIPVINYRVYFGTEPDPATLLYEGTGTSYETVELTENTKYYWKVVPFNAYGPASGVPVWSFTTIRATQLAESFEADWSPPVGWMKDPNSFWFQSTESKYHLQKSIYRSTTSTQAKIQTPLVNIQNGDQLEFFAGTASSEDQRLRVYYSSDRSIWTETGPELEVIPGKWTFYSVDLSALEGNQYYLGIATYYVAGGKMAQVYLDHVTGPDVVPVPPVPATFVYPGDTMDWIATGNSLIWWPGLDGGMPEGYRIYAGTDGGGTTAPINLANGVSTGTNAWTPPAALNDNTVYYWQIVPFNQTGDAELCPIWSFKTAPAGGVQIGRGDVDYLDQPIYPEYNYSYTQAIYLQNEINISGKQITKIYYQWSGGTGGEACRDWEIFMGHTSKTAFASENDWIPVAQMTGVFDGEVILPETAGWVLVELDVPFPYNNSDNLVIAVHENTPGYSSGLFFYGTDLDTTRSLVFYDDDMDPDPESPPEADFMHLGVANIRLQLEGTSSIHDISSPGIVNASLHLYPIPAKDKLYISIQEKIEIRNIRILNMQGRILKNIHDPALSGRFEVDINDLPAGVYIIQVTGNGRLISGTFMVQ